MKRIATHCRAAFLKQWWSIVHVTKLQQQKRKRYKYIGSVGMLNHDFVLSEPHFRLSKWHLAVFVQDNFNV